MTERPQTPMHVDEAVSSYPDRQAGISWPLPVDAKLEQLLTAARSVGERTSRREIVAAVIAMTANFTGEELSVLLRSYRLAHVGDILTSPKATNVVEFTKHGPGPRRWGT
jgi:hypothetical protein